MGDGHDGFRCHATLPSSEKTCFFPPHYNMVALQGGGDRYLMLLVLSRRTAYEGGCMLLSTDTTLPAALLPSLSTYHNLQSQRHLTQCPNAPMELLRT